MEIHLLPEHIIDQIKAGEVIDSPAGIIKELIENSIDAGSDKIEIHLVNNGLDLISLKDNGKGISYEDLPLAFARHATSKIEKFEDLYHCSSFGFRGEALASLASVAKVTCLSSTLSEPGQKILIEGGKLSLHEKLESSRPLGTEIFIKDLFYNTPARFKFMTSQAGEKSRIKKIIHFYLLSHPEVEFSVRWDDNDKVIYPKTTQKDRFFKITKNTEDETFIIENQYDDLELLGFIGKKEKSRPVQYCFVNHRPIEDDRIKNTINHTLLSYGWSRKQDWIVNLSIPTNKVDINVHPKKTKIKFFQPALVYSLISNALKHHLKSLKVPLAQENFFEPEAPRPLSEFQTSTTTLPRTEKEQFIGSKVSFSHTTEKISVLKIDEGILFEQKGELYGSSYEELSLKLSETLLGGKQAITPLLVSTPLDLKTICPECLSLLQQLQIEVYAIEESYWVIKSLPNILADFPATALNRFISALDERKDLKTGLTELLKATDSTGIELLHELKFFSRLSLKDLK